MPHSRMVMPLGVALKVLWRGLVSVVTVDSCGCYFNGITNFEGAKEVRVVDDESNGLWEIDISCDVGHLNDRLLFSRQAYFNLFPFSPFFLRSFWSVSLFILVIGRSYFEGRFSRDGYDVEYYHSGSPRAINPLGICASKSSLYVFAISQLARTSSLARWGRFFDLGICSTHSL